MITKPFKVYLSTEDHEALMKKAEDVNIKGRGWLSYYLRRLAHTPICYLDENLKTFLGAVKLK